MPVVGAIGRCPLRGPADRVPAAAATKEKTRKKQRAQSPEHERQVPQRRTVPKANLDLTRSGKPHASEHTVYSNDRLFFAIYFSAPSLTIAIGHCQDARQVCAVLDPDLIRRQVELLQTPGWLPPSRVGLRVRIR